MFITKDPIVVGFDKNGNKEVVAPDTEVTAKDFPSKKAFDRLCEIGAIDEVKGAKPAGNSGAKALTKVECIKIILADEVNANGVNDEQLSEGELNKLKAADLNEMVKKINAEE